MARNPAPAVSAPDACAPDEHQARKAAKRAPTHAVERAAAIFRAAGDEARLRLLEQLSDGEWCVSELAAAAGAGLSTVSQQLRLLRSEHLVKRRRAGKHVYYALADEHVARMIRDALAHAVEEHAHHHDDE
jgi:ArsR family transcriptional regulator, lead/cadmium/zinc/bismuth-responsive transcriptional repressor